MPREQTDTTNAYETRRPPSPDRRASTNGQFSVNPYTIKPAYVKQDCEIPWINTTQRVDWPCDSRWVRKVNGIKNGAVGMHIFPGRYICVGRDKIPTKPGDIYLVGTDAFMSGVLVPVVCLYVHACYCQWLLAGEEQQAPGWHVRLQPAVTRWFRLTRGARVSAALRELTSRDADTLYQRLLMRAHIAPCGLNTANVEDTFLAFSMQTARAQSTLVSVEHEDAPALATTAMTYEEFVRYLAFMKTAQKIANSPGQAIFEAVEDFIARWQANRPSGDPHRVSLPEQPVPATRKARRLLLRDND